MKLRKVLTLSRPPLIPSSKLTRTLSISAPAILLAQRVIFIFQGLFDIETPVIIDGLNHPWLNAGEAPYGAIWYAINIPIGLVAIPSFSPEQSWLTITSIIDSLVLFLLLRY